MKTVYTVLLTLSLSFAGNAQSSHLVYPATGQVQVDDPMWTPLLQRINSVTIPDILDKFEGRHIDHDSNPTDNFWSPDRKRVSAADAKQQSHNTLHNFELVAEGHVADGGHFGFPWFDGLIYETITGISDYLQHYPNQALEQRLDEYIRRIVAAQTADSDGYINTYTTLQENNHRWGENGGNLRWQHDVYNSGCLVEAGIHYYIATGKTALLEAATRLANYMYDYMVATHHNVVPGHALPEDALIQLYQLYKSQPQLSARLSVPVHPENYLRLVEYWIEQRGHTQGRRPLEAYAQDAESVFDAQTIEGHAVRATLFATGVTSTALVNSQQRYIQASHRLWDNMVGRRMFITGGVGAIHEDEKFGPDYYLPTDAYLETCAAIGAGLFSWRMNQLTGDAKYIDILERILFNSIPTALSHKGDNYTYQNPLNADKMNRWPWHDCPCCPPMLLKMTGQLPAMIYATRGIDIYVNLFIGSSTQFDVPGAGKVQVSQQVDWNTGKVSIQVTPEHPASPLRVFVRMPGWSNGQEFPLGLYHSNASKQQYKRLQDGYLVYSGKKAQKINLQLNVKPRLVQAVSQVQQLQQMHSLASGPFVYCLERIDNQQCWENLSIAGQHFVLDTQHPIMGATPLRSRDGRLTAIPFYMIANRCADTAYRVWSK